jgi:exonuclease III
MVNTDTDSLTNSKTNQLSKNDPNQLYRKHVKNDDINNRFIIYHQNIRGLKGKINEFMLSLPAEVPHLICFTEHHLKDYELNNTHIPKYKLGANYCRKNLKWGGVCIYVHEILKFTNINLLKYSKEQDIEIGAITLNIQKENVIILCIYRAQCGNFDRFLNKLEINCLHKHNSEFIICGDININYLESSNKKNQLDNLLGTYNLIDTIFFPQE